MVGCGAIVVVVVVVIEVERKSLILRGKQKSEQKIHERFFLITQKRKTHTHTHARFLQIIMPSVASFAVKKDDVVHAQANDTIKRCVEMLVMKGGFVTLKVI